MPKTRNQDDAVIGARIRAARQLADVSQEVLGAHLGVTFQQVQKYEKGANRVSASQIGRIAAFLQADVAKLIFGGEPAYEAAPLKALDHEAARAITALPAGRVKSAILSLIEAAA